MATPNVRVLGARSSLLNHDFPYFYACYLLKSARLPLSRKATYIGSTPNPPRRIRQHNGELQAGARRTVSKRPWVMQMIIHGFPSRLAALQFEWAWQNPHKSRHFREDGLRIFGNRGTNRVDKLIQIVRTMITRHPFNTWPLHVKLFTEEAVKMWEAASAAKYAPPMPTGFTCAIELEGVDGKSGHPGSGRKGPIAVDDGDFTNTHLAKHTSLLATRRRLECNICHKPMHSYATEPLETSLCPFLHCTAVSHLLCLSQYFLASEAADKKNQNKSEFIPRGGNCRTCGNHILWGDVIRGSYRRFRAMQKTQDGADNAVVEDDLFVSDEDDFSGADEEGNHDTPIKKKRQLKERSTFRSPRGKSVDKKRTKRVSSRGSSSGESFDFDNISSSSGSEPSTVRRRGRSPKIIGLSSLVSPGSSKRSVKPNNESVRRGPGRPRKEISTAAGVPDHALESSNSEGRPNRSRGRPRSKDSPSSSGLPSSPLKNKGKAKASDTQETFTMDDIRAALASIEDPLGLKMARSLLSSDTDDMENLVKRQRRRPRKSSILPSLQIPRISSGAEEPAKRKPGQPRKTSSIETLSEVSKRSRPRREAAPASSSTAISKGKARQDQNPGASPVIPSNHTTPEMVKRSRGRPRNETPMFPNHNESILPSLQVPRISSSTEEPAKSKPGRPRKTSSIETLSEVSKRGRPRSSSTALSKGKARQDQSPRASPVMPSNQEIVKRSLGRPRNEAPVSPNHNDSTPISIRKRGRPRKIDVTPPWDDIMTKSGSGSENRRPGRPRKEKSPLSPSTISNGVPVKPKAGRTRTFTDAGLTSSTRSTKSRSPTVSGKKGMHTQSVGRESSSGESFDFNGLSDEDASDEDFDLFLARITKRLKSQKVSQPPEPTRNSPGKLHTAVVPESLSTTPNVITLQCSIPGDAKDLPIVVISD